MKFLYHLLPALIFVELVASLFLQTRVKENQYAAISFPLLKFLDVIWCPRHKPNFQFSDSTEPGVANDLGLVFPTKVNEMKSPSMAASSVVMIPSPIFLWRFKVIFFCILVPFSFFLFFIVWRWVSYFKMVIWFLQQYIYILNFLYLNWIT